MLHISVQWLWKQAEDKRFSTTDAQESLQGTLVLDFA